MKLPNVVLGILNLCNQHNEGGRRRIVRLYVSIRKFILMFHKCSVRVYGRCVAHMHIVYAYNGCLCLCVCAVLTTTWLLLPLVLAHCSSCRACVTFRLLRFKGVEAQWSVIIIVMVWLIAWWYLGIYAGSFCSHLYALNCYGDRTGNIFYLAVWQVQGESGQ